MVPIFQNSKWLIIVHFPNVLNDAIFFLIVGLKSLIRRVIFKFAQKKNSEIFFSENYIIFH